jgi:two-component system, cell cycle sensor histidine kinase and response regulator CckA
MQNESSTWTGSNITFFVSGVSATSVLLGLLAIVHSMLSREAGPARESLVPAADAGVAFILLGISLGILARWPQGRWKRLFAQLSALAVVVWAVTTLIHVVALKGPGFKQWLLHWTQSGDGATMIVMSATSASNFILLALALLIAPLQKAYFHTFTKILCFCSASIAFVCAMDAFLLPDVSYSGTGLLSCVMFMACSIAIPLAQTGKLPAVVAGQGIGSQAFRRLLPAAVIIPIALAWLTLQGEMNGRFGGEFGGAAAALATVLLLGILIWWNAKTLNRHESMLQQAQEELKRERADLETRVQERTGALLTANRALEQEMIEHLKADQALEASERKYRSLVENSPYGIYQSTSDGQLLYANPAFARMLGQVAGFECAGFGLTDLYVDSQTRRSLLPELMKQRSFRGVEVQWQHADGSPITVRLSGRMVQDDASLGPVFEVTAEDITEYRMLEEQFLQVQKMEAVGRLAAGISHDFNNILGVIIGQIELLNDSLSEDHPAKTNVDRVRQAARRAIILIRQLLTFSRQETIQPRVLNLNGAVESVAELLRPMIGEDIELRISLEKSLVNIQADPAQIDQIVMNLAVNARDAMQQGGIITLRTANVTLDRTYQETHRSIPPGNYVMLSVSDTGSGMDPQTRARVFEPFFTTKAPGKGTGLGLSTVYGIVAKSGGHIWVYSEPDHGTTFKIYFPQVTDAIEPSSQETNAESLKGSETILLVEDDEAVRVTTTAVLEGAGYHVLTAGSALVAIELARMRDTTIDLVLTDVVMPIMSGAEMLPLLRAFRPGLKAIFMSGYAGEHIAARGLNVGDVLLEKPFSKNDLLQQIRKMISRPSVAG